MRQELLQVSYGNDPSGFDRKFPPKHRVLVVAACSWPVTFRKRQEASLLETDVGFADAHFDIDLGTPRTIVPA